MQHRMRVIPTDILADLCGLSLGLILLVLPVGFVLWLFGWRSHRFWIVLLTTVLAGIFGLQEASSWRAQPIVAAVLLAIAAGVLALALVRVIAFISAGVAGLYLLQMLTPALNQPAIAFLVCGLLGLLLFRWCFMALTSFTGTCLMVAAGLALLHYYECFDAVRWCEENSLTINSLVGVTAFCGFTVQFALHRRQMRLERGGADDGPLALIFSMLKSTRKAA
jgi:hypothetical protein